MFKLEYGHGNLIHSFEDIYCAYDCFGSKYLAIKAITLFMVQSMHIYMESNIRIFVNIKNSYLRQKAMHTSYSHSSSLGLYKESYLVHT